MIQYGRPRGRLPLHPRPMPHEALSSWSGRLAAAYDMDPDVFLRTALGIDPAPDDRELDVYAGPPGLAAALAERTGVSVRRIRAMSLAGYASELTGVSSTSSSGTFDAPAGRFGWFLPRAGGIRADLEPAGPRLPWQADDLLDGMPRCCPRCLWADAAPYVRLHWRCAWMASCPQHEEALVPVVAEPWLARNLLPREPEDAAPDLLALDGITLGAVTDGTAQLPRRGGAVPGSAWLRALRALLGELACPVSWFAAEARAEVDAAWRSAGRTFGERELCQSEHFERQSPDRRRALLEVAGAVVRRRAGRLKSGGQAAALRATVMQWRAEIAPV